MLQVWHNYVLVIVLLSLPGYTVEFIIVSQGVKSLSLLRVRLASSLCLPCEVRRVDVTHA